MQCTPVALPSNDLEIHSRPVTCRRKRKAFKTALKQRLIQASSGPCTWSAGANRAMPKMTSEAKANYTPLGGPSAALESEENVENCLMEVDAPELHVDIGASESSISLNMLEPTRFLHSNAPPRRFHRTTWRSMAIRIHALSSMWTKKDGL